MMGSLPLYIGKRLLKSYNLFEFKPSQTPARRQAIRPERGLSLLEALVVLFILATAAASVVPNLISWRASMRLQVTINELLGDLQSAKALAAKHNTTMTVQFEPTESRYQITYTNSEGDVVALKREAFPPELSIDTSHPDYTLANHRTTFTSRGGATPGTLVVGSIAGKSKKIVISSIGKIRVGN